RGASRCLPPPASTRRHEAPRPRLCASPACFGKSASSSTGGAGDYTSAFAAVGGDPGGPSKGRAIHRQAAQRGDPGRRREGGRGRSDRHQGSADGRSIRERGKGRENVSARHYEAGPREGLDLDQWLIGDEPKGRRRREARDG